MLLLAVPIVVGIFTWSVAREGRRQSIGVRHALRVELALERLMSHLKDAETSQRGYLLTGEARYLEPYHAAAAEVGRDLTFLASLSTRQHPAVVRIGPLVDSRLAQLEQTLQLYHAGRLDVDAAKDGIDRGRDLMDAIRSASEEMRTAEEGILQERELAWSRISQFFFWSLGIGYVVIVLTVASLYRQVRLYGQQSAEAEEGLSRLNAELDQRVQERTALLEAREELLKSFVKYVPAAVAMLDSDMRYLQVSDRWYADYSLGDSQILGCSHYEIFPDMPGRWKEIHSRCLKGETLRAEEDQWHRADGQVAWLRWEIRPWGSRNGLPEGILIFSEDITQRKQMQEMLRESEATTRALLETAAQAILAIDGGGRIVLANKTAAEMFGYETSHELLGRPLEMLVPERLRSRHEIHRAEFSSNPKTRPMGTGVELSGLRKNGSEFPIEVSLSSVATRRGPLAVSFVSDITARKQAETALRNSEQQLRALAGSLLTAQENERRRVARELHDDVTQRLAFLSIELGKLGSEIPDSLEETRARVRALQDQTLRVSGEVRRLSHGLHPSVIADFGLSVALEEYCQEFEKAQGVHVEFEGLVEDSELDASGATCLYRIAQESMRNAVNHGRATHVRVELSAGARSMQLRIKDNGLGFSTDGARTKTGLGVVSMQERIRLVNGNLVLSSKVGAGTEITASVPLTGVVNGAGAHSAG